MDQALERASNAQRDRFLAAIATEDQGVAPVVHGATPVVESVELPRRIEASELGPVTLEQGAKGGQKS